VPVVVVLEVSASSCQPPAMVRSNAPPTKGNLLPVVVVELVSAISQLANDRQGRTRKDCLLPVVVVELVSAGWISQQTRRAGCHQ
jgi:hypothetical protein